MTATFAPEWRWEIAQDPNEVHELLRVSDLAQATNAAPAPQRNEERTHFLVKTGCVRLLRKGADAIAMYALTETPPFVLNDAPFQFASHPLYLQRLAIEPDCARTLGSVPGINALRHAIEVARDGRADALRSEANPHLTRTLSLLISMGFEVQNPNAVLPSDNRVYLEVRIRPGRAAV
ncbi:hypothetical protein MOV61_06685 [Neorhizobium sp. BETTINA12A]|uniref:hypothetical protein n=1 Tax=Neorhizobium sp. BETTINA12A TaxID=2908924 RepID=UPI001FF181C1|nr:hypothetical protein [Neorhizobium sp. BETTINA12A]MCJ9750405.1 hypothetical protein [Neorhizobium sp. BETTINA12A]